MKKPYKEEKAGLRIELVKLNIIIIAFIFSNRIFPQIPINGFCKLNSFAIDTSLTSLISLNFNNDSYTDLFMFNPDTNKVVILPGEKNGKFGERKDYSTTLPITKILPLNNQSEKIKDYIFTSRKKMEAGILTFSKKGKPLLKDEIMFHSYPDNISIADINDDKNDEALISGSAFNGLTVLYQSNRKLLQKKIVDKTSYSDAVLIDLTNDQHNDIAAFNILTNSIDFFYNDGRGNFDKARSLKVDGKVSMLKAVDMNLDYYQDLLLIQKDSIKILYGDFASSYDTSVTIATFFHPDKIITGDFNRDGQIDIAYINYENSTLSLIFAKSARQFYPEIIYTMKKGLNDLIPYYSKFIDGIMAISGRGSLLSITHLSSMFENVCITAGANPVTISYFDNENNGINDLCYIDSFNNKLNIILRNSSGIPSELYSYSMYKLHTKIYVFNNSANIKTFYCYSKGKKLIEMYKVNFSKNKVLRNSIYSHGKIEDLKINKSNNGKPELLVAYVKNSSLGLDIFDYDEFKYSNTNYSNLSDSVLNPVIITKKNIGLAYWQKKDNIISLSNVLVELGVKNSKYKLRLNKPDSLQLNTFCANLFNNNSDEIVSLVNTGGKKYAVVSSAKKTYIFNNNELSGNFGNVDNSQFCFGNLSPNSEKKLFVYWPHLKIIDKFEFSKNGKDLTLKNLANVNNLKDYFITNMNFKDSHLVYIDSVENCIKIDKINQ